MSERPTLSTIPDVVGQDQGLRANTAAADIAGGQAAADLMNGVIRTAIDATGVNDDGMLTARDLGIMSRYIRANPELYEDFVIGHGDDDGNEETGFHLVQGDGGTLKFQGRNYIDTVADAIYHVGFRIQDGRFLNEDGNANERVDDVAGWLNYFVNGENIVYGSSASETLYSGVYSDELSDAASETFRAGRGDDKIWAGDGDDIVYAGAGNDVSAGDDGDDTMYGNSGNDKLWAGKGDDVVFAGAGNDIATGDVGDDELHGNGGADKLWAGDGNDVVMGGSGADTIGGGAGDDMLDGGNQADTIWGEEGDDTMLGGRGNDTMGGGDGDDAMDGGAGRDKMWGDDGNDVMQGGRGADEVGGGAGEDRISGGAGRDLLLDWEEVEARDTFVFVTGDTGNRASRADEIRGFTSGIDQIDLSGWDTRLAFTDGDFSADGSGEVRYDDGYVQIDADGNGRADALIKLAWVASVDKGDFVL